MSTADFYCGWMNSDRWGGQSDLPTDQAPFAQELLVDLNAASFLSKS